jgi:hypothetical protein
MNLAANNYDAYRAFSAPVIDGIANEASWEAATWAPIDQLWTGRQPSSTNCTARFKSCWSGSKIYILMEVVDDVLVNWNPKDPLKNYPSNDCPEIFLDEDGSGGEHARSFNAFAYHISTLYDVVDMDIDGDPKLFNNHIEVKRSSTGSTYLWEMAVTVYTDKYVYEQSDNEIANLFVGKVLGFSAAYNDSDLRFETREAMLGSAKIEPWTCSGLGYADAGTNCSWQTASVFGKMTLRDLPLELEQHRDEKSPSITLAKVSDGFRLQGVKGNNNVHIKVYNSIGTFLKGESMLPDQLIEFPPHEINRIFFIVIEEVGAVTKHKVEW